MNPLSLLQSPIDRRALMLGSAAAAAGAVASTTLSRPVAAATSALTGDFDPMDKQHNLDAFMKLTGSLDGEDHFGWFKGRIFSVIGDFEVIKPLFDVEGFGASRVEAQPDGSYKKLQREVGYYKDLYSGQIIETWKNPMLDGEEVEIFHINNDPVNVHLKTEVVLGFGADEDETTESFSFLMPWDVMGGVAMTSFDVNLDWKNKLDPEVWPRASVGPRVRVSENQQWHMNVDELNDLSAPKIHNTGSWNRIANWLPWMLMGQREGHLFYRSHTAGLNGLEDLPKDILDYTEKNFTKYLEAPKEWVEPNESSFEVYARDASPKT